MPQAVQSETLDLIWRQDPDSAISAGRLPPVFWEDLSESGRTTALQESARLIAVWEALQGGADAHVACAAIYHLRCAMSATRDRGIADLNHMTGPAARLVWAAHSWPFAEDPDGSAYRDHLTTFPRYCSSLARLASGGRPQHEASRPVLEAFIMQVDGLCGTSRLAEGPIARALERTQAAQRGKSVVEECLEAVFDGLTRLRSLAEALLPSARPASPWAPPDESRRRYGDAVYRGTSIDITPEALERRGMRILESTATRFHELRDHDVPAENLDRDAALGLFRAAHERLMSGLPSVCASVPDTPCNVEEMPEAIATVGPPAYYGPPSLRNGRAGALYVNTSEPIRTHAWEVLPLAMHEGVPGHHLQHALLDEHDRLPEILRLLSVNALTEGWAVYAETLASAMGLDLSPLEEFGLLAHQRWRAARLVVDVGLHVRSWSVARAVAFMSAATLQSADVVGREVVRYLAWPGQALGYMVGADVVRAHVAHAVRTGTSLPEAHTRLLLLGSVPLTCLQAGGESP